MRKTILIAAALCSTLVSGSAFAATNPKEPYRAQHQGGEGTDGQDTGAIVSINTQNNTITLADGDVYKLPGYLAAKSMQVGEMVRVGYTLSASGDLAAVKSVNVD